jgi:SulP family sulfate permease
VLLSGFFFAHKIGQILLVHSDRTPEVHNYQVVGQVFFASAERFVNAFDFDERVSKVVIDVSRAHFWDITAVSALDKVVFKFRCEGVEVEVRGLNQASATLVDKFAVHDKDGKDLIIGH